jgi:hypothetical protein
MSMPAIDDIQDREKSTAHEQSLRGPLRDSQLQRDSGQPIHSTQFPRLGGLVFTPASQA